MASTLRSLTVWLRAKTAQFNAAMTGATKRTSGLGRTLGKLKGQLLAGIGLYTVIRALRFAITESVKFEKSMAAVATMLDGTATKQMEEFSSAILDLASNTGQATEALASGLYDILSAGIDAAHAMQVLRTSTMAAVGGLTDAGTAADAVTTMLNAYSLSSERAVEVADFLAVTVQQGKTRFAELAPTIGKVATVARQAGITMDELGAGISTITRAGIATDKAMTSLLGVLTVFLKPSDDAVRVANKFGIALNTATLKAIGLIGVLRKLKSEGATIEDLGKIFPKRALIGAGALTGDLGGFATDIEAQVNKMGMAFEDAGKMADTAAAKWGRFGEAAARAGMMVGDAVLAFAAPVGDTKETMLKWFMEAQAAADSTAAKMKRLQEAEAAIFQTWTPVARKAALEELIKAQTAAHGESEYRDRKRLRMVKKLIAAELEITAAVEARARAAKIAADADKAGKTTISDMNFGARMKGKGANAIAAERAIRANPGMSQGVRASLRMHAELLDKADAASKKAAEAARAAAGVIAAQKKDASDLIADLTKRASDFGKTEVELLRERIGKLFDPHDIDLATEQLDKLVEKMYQAELSSFDFGANMEEAAKTMQRTRLAGAVEVGAGFQGHAAAFRNANPMMGVAKKNLAANEKGNVLLKDIIKRIGQPEVSNLN